MLLKSHIPQKIILSLCLFVAPTLVCAQSWQSVNATGTPPQYTDWTNTVFDTQHGTLLLTQDDSNGGSGIYADAVFSFNPTNGNWTQLWVSDAKTTGCPGDTATRPNHRHTYNQIAWDSTRGHMYITSGSCQGALGYDLYSFTHSGISGSGAWTKAANPSNNPGNRQEGAMVYMPNVDRVMLYGGFAGASGSTGSDTWEYNPGTNTWTQICSGCAPGARHAQIMVYDDASGKVIMNGGQRSYGGADISSTYLYDPTTHTWSAANPAVEAPASSYTCHGYDKKRDRLLIYPSTGHVYSYTTATNTWKDLGIAGGPPADPGTPDGKADTYCGYDSTHDYFVYFASAGAAGGPPHTSVINFSGTGSPSPTPTPTPNPTPSPTPSPSPTPTPTPNPSPTPTPTPSPTPTPTPPPSGHVLQVGPGKQFAKPCAAIAAAVSGDTIEIDSSVTYVGDVCAWSTNNLTLIGVGGGRAHIDAGGLNSQGKGIWVISGKNNTVENIEFSGATVPDHNGVGIRAQGDNLTVRNCYFHDNEEGILTDSSPTSTVTIEFSEFAFNGFGDGQSHNLYINHVGTLIFRYNYSHHAKIGHLLKSRAAQNFILYNRLSDEATGTSSYQIDLPNGGKSYVIGNLIEQGPNNDNSTFIAYLEEGTNAANPSHKLFVVANTFRNDAGSGTFVSPAGSADPVVIRNNIFSGPGAITNQASALKSGNFTGNPMFVNQANYDYHLTSGSPARGKAVAPGSDGTFSLTAVFQYVHPACAEGRKTIGAMDAGAYEFGGGTGVPPANGTCGSGTASVQPVIKNPFPAFDTLAAAFLPTRNNLRR